MFDCAPLPPASRYTRTRMDQDHLRGLLEQVRAGAVDVDAAMERMRHLPFEDLGFAKVDHHRALRHGIPEVVFGKGKTPDQISAIVASLLDKAQNVLVTRADAPTAERLQREHPQAEYFPASGAVRVWRDRTLRGKGQDRRGVRRHQRSAGGRRSASHRGGDGQRGDRHSRYRRRRHPSRDAESRAAVGSPRGDRVRGHGRRAAERGRRAGDRAGDRRAHQRRLRGEFPGPGGPAGHAE